MYLVLLLILFQINNFCHADCVYDLSDPLQRPQRMPFVLEPQSMKHYKLINNQLRIPVLKSILLICDFYDESNKLNVRNSEFYPLFNCSKNGKLIYREGYYDREINFKEANCEKSQIYLHKYQYEEDKCGKGVKIGISYTANRTTDDIKIKEKVIVDIIGICYDNNTSNPIYIHVKISNDVLNKSLSTIGSYVHLDTIPSEFEELYEEYFIPTNFDYFFNISYMNLHLNSILDNNMFIDGHRMISVNLINDVFLPLMLTEVIDSRLTRIPMWEILSKGNWEHLQQDIRLLVSNYNKQRSIDIYAGTHGILTLTDRNGLNQPLYLQNDINYGRVIPVPEYVWTVIYSSEEKNAVAIVTQNNPYVVNITETIFCKDICDQILWFKNLDPRKILSGPVFCCEFLDFRKTVDSMPFLNEGVVGLLVK